MSLSVLLAAIAPSSNCSDYSSMTKGAGCFAAAVNEICPCCGESCECSIDNGTKDNQSQFPAPMPRNDSERQLKILAALQTTFSETKFYLSVDSVAPQGASVRFSLNQPLFILNCLVLL